MTAAASALGLGPLLGEPTESAQGRQGVIWRVETDQGRYAVKELLVELTEAEAQTDVAFQATMVDRGVPAPRPVRTPTGEVLVTAHDVQFRAYTWVDLQGPRPDLDPQVVGTVLATLHRDPLAADPATVDGWYADPVPEREWQEALTPLVAARAPFAAEFAESIPAFIALQQVFRRPQDPQMCHRDLWSDNLRVTHDGALCVIDWDNCGSAEATQELAMPLVDFCYEDGDRAALLYRAYRQAGGPGRLTDPSDFTMVLAQFGHFALAAAQQWLESPDTGEQARAEAWFREGWDRPLGRPQIERLLEAVRGI